MLRLQDLILNDKRILVRVDFNVPLDHNGNITDQNRINAVLPTLRHILKHKGRLIIISHLGRPKGQKKSELTLAPVAKALGKLLDQEVKLASDCIGAEVEAMVAALTGREVLLLENLRFHPQEQANDHEFAQKLGGLCDIYVNDAFAVSHRVNASVAAITEYAPQSVAGLLLQQELDYFKKAMHDPRRPLTVIVGGAKVSSKLNAIKNMLEHVDKMLIGGAMANTFLKSQGYNLGKSMVEEDLLEDAAVVIKDAKKLGVKLYLPVDMIIALKCAADIETRQVAIQEIPEQWMALDIGPATAILYSQALAYAGTIIWNGPMGVFEIDDFAYGTIKMVETVAKSSALTIVGGGDTDMAVHKYNQVENISYISTGGGAFLALMEGKSLPAVAALEEHSGV